ncbi:hypothetical protein HanXRQr2_Chr13g0592271 [Helianthus annuus]|uniref:Uncharacterized protein n=1 Tax=Helianthus annuus TaxID=4232 RepID=A0A9K3EIM3_HELAN|nr:hypothetical protein HanXRQr2_Chr13g0592271 [Helianthus annuus]
MINVNFRIRNRYGLWALNNFPGFTFSLTNITTVIRINSEPVLITISLRIPIIVHFTSFRAPSRPPSAASSHWRWGRGRG